MTGWIVALVVGLVAALVGWVRAVVSGRRSSDLARTAVALAKSGEAERVAAAWAAARHTVATTDAVAEKRIDDAARDGSLADTLSDLGHRRP